MGFGRILGRIFEIPGAMTACGLAAGAAAEVVFAGEDEVGAIHVVVAALDEGLVWIGGGFRHGGCLPEALVAGGAGVRKAGWLVEWRLLEDGVGER